MQALVNSSLNFFGKSGHSSHFDAVVTNRERTQEEKDHIIHGQRGHIVFQCCQRLPCVDDTSTDSSAFPSMDSSEYREELQHIHILLYKGILQVYCENETRTINIGDITKITRGADHTIFLSCGASNTLPPLCYKFHGPLLADSFQQYIEYWQDSGSVIQQAFDLIDRDKKGFITPKSLSEAMYEQGVSSLLPDADANTRCAPSDDVAQMLSLTTPVKKTADSLSFDYDDFFHVFLDIPMHSLYGCLVEWKAKANDRIQPSEQLPPPPQHVANVSSSSHSLNPTLLAGETVANIVRHVKWYLGGTAASIASAMKSVQQSHSSQHLTSILPKDGVFSPPFQYGTMMITNYRIIFLADDRTCKRYGIPSCFNRHVIPLNCMAQITLTSKSNHSFGYHFKRHSSHQKSFQLQTKDLRTMFVVLLKQPQDGVETIVHMLHQFCFSGNRAQLFAFNYSRTFPVDTWSLCDIRLDYKRMHLHVATDWQIFDNTSFDLCDSYPPHIVLPSCMSNENIKEAAKHRSRQRLPVVTYRDHASGSCLLRSSQPLVGLAQNTSVCDEMLLNACRLSSGSLAVDTTNREENGATLQIENENYSRHFYIMDARGKMAATVNSVMGKGTEDVSRYPSTYLEFCNIDNIHVMRASFAALQSIVVPSILGGDNDSFFFSKLCDCGWLKHTRQLLLAAVTAAEKMRLRRSSVLIHCSDGWDRTAQICLLSQLILDPHYRTIRGFCLLVEKEFCAFGYKFQDRCGHAEVLDSLPDERSPVFVQALDATYQLLHQFPQQFEFTSELLVFLADHMHSGLFGNFLGNSEKQRIHDLNVRNATQSIWSYIFSQPAQFLQVHYEPYTGALWPQTGMKQLHLWERFFCRWNITSHPRTVMQVSNVVPAVCQHNDGSGGGNGGDGSVGGVTWRDDWGGGQD